MNATLFAFALMLFSLSASTCTEDDESHNATLNPTKGNTPVRRNFMLNDIVEIDYADGQIMIRSSVDAVYSLHLTNETSGNEVSIEVVCLGGYSVIPATLQSGEYTASLYNQTTCIYATHIHIE